MDNKSNHINIENKDNDDLNNIKAVGNFTKNAVKTFEENIVEKKDFLESIKSK